MLPPTTRDFEIHRHNLVEHLSTYALAERYKISQTRVRQVVYRVGQWLASILPARSDVEKAEEARLAQCLAADQLQSQAEKLQVFWEQTHDVKYLRQQSRVIMALARLGVVPGAIDAAAADVMESGPDERGGVSPAVAPADHEIQPFPPAAAADLARPEARPVNPLVGDCSAAADAAPDGAAA
jgi:hypothetical protein